MTQIAIGSPLPPFRLTGHDGSTVDNDVIRGKAVLFSFHPLAWTGVCLRQMEALEMNAERFADLGAVAYGVSVDSVPCKKAWADSMGLEKTLLLSDFWPHGAFASSVGLFREADGISERAVIIADPTGVIRFAKVLPIGEVPDLEEQIEELKKITS